MTSPSRGLLGRAVGCCEPNASRGAVALALKPTRDECRAVAVFEAATLAPLARGAVPGALSILP